MFPVSPPCCFVLLFVSSFLPPTDQSGVLPYPDAPKETSVSLSPSDGLSPGNQVNLTCSSRAKPAVSQFVWLKRSPDGTQTEIKGPVLYNIILAEGEVYVCIAVHDFGNQTSAEIRVTGKERFTEIISRNHLNQQGATTNYYFERSASEWKSISG